MVTDFMVMSINNCPVLLKLIRFFLH